MSKTTLTKTPNGEDIVIMARADYETLISKQEDREDKISIIEYLQSKIDGSLKLHPLTALEH